MLGFLVSNGDFGQGPVLNELSGRVKQPKQLMSIEKRLKIYEYLSGISDGYLTDRWIMQTIQMWDRMVAQCEIPTDDVMEFGPVHEDLVLACLLYSYNSCTNYLDKQSGEEPRDTSNDLTDEDIRDEIFRVGMRGATTTVKTERWKKILGMRDAIRTMEPEYTPTFLDFALDLSENVRDLANQDGDAMEAETQGFLAWEMIEEASDEPRTCHSLVTGMLIEMAVMFMPHETYKVPALVVGTVAAMTAFDRFSWHPTLPVLQAYLRKTFVIVDDDEMQKCIIFEETLIELWRRLPASVVSQKWADRATLDGRLLRIAPPAIKDAVTPRPRKRLRGKSATEEESPPRVEMERPRSKSFQNEGVAPIKKQGRPRNEDDSAKNKPKKKYYKPVAEKRAGGSRIGSGRKKKAAE